MATPDPVALQTYIDLWVVQHGQEWTTVTPEMLFDCDSFEGGMIRALSQANLLEQCYLNDRMEFRAKLKEGV